MRIFLTFLLGLVPESLGLNQDQEGSDYDPVSSGSGDWSLTGERTNAMDTSFIRKDLMNEEQLWNIDQSEYIILPNSKNYWENEQIVAAVTAGGVVAAVVAALVTGVVVYMRHQKLGGVYFRGHRKHRERRV